MYAFIRLLGMLMVLPGLVFLITSCADDEDAAPPSEQQLAWQAALELLEVMPMDSGALVTFVGPMVPGSGLVSDEGAPEPASLRIPWDNGHRTYLFFINDHPNQRYVHDVRYAWVNMNDRSFGYANATWWPRLDAWPVPDNSEFILLGTQTISDIVFYYGRGGGAGFPPTFLPGP